MDGPSIISSAVLLLVLLALTFQRILGLDRLITKAVRCVLHRGAVSRDRFSLALCVIEQIQKDPGQ
jgi:hypothetical protein